MRVNKYNLHKLHQRYILFFFSFFFSNSKTLILKDSSVRERVLGFQRAVNSIGSPQDESERERDRRWWAGVCVMGVGQCTQFRCYNLCVQFLPNMPIVYSDYQLENDKGLPFAPGVRVAPPAAVQHTLTQLRLHTCIHAAETVNVQIPAAVPQQWCRRLLGNPHVPPVHLE